MSLNFVFNKSIEILNQVNSIRDNEDNFLAIWTKQFLILMAALFLFGRKLNEDGFAKCSVIYGPALKNRWITAP